jgi:hypothetical protein
MSEFFNSKLFFKLGGPSRFPGLAKLLASNRMKPAFFIVGFQKSGTTTLYELLCSHPNVERGLIKENNILAEPKDRLVDFQLCFPVKSKGKITGDASHLHTWMPFGLERIKNHFPEAKILVIMRNPIERAYSLFNMDKKIGYLPPNLTFEQYIDIEIQLRETITNPKDADDQYKNMRFYGNKYGWALSRGLYHLYLEKLERLGLTYQAIFLEELNSSFNSEWKRIEDFIGLPHHEISSMEQNKGKYVEPISLEAQGKLEGFYKEPNARLVEILGRSLPWT